MGPSSNLLVSVCLITYKHESYIRQALDSVVMQNVNFSWEVIIADDCSPDNTRQIILEYKSKYPDLIKLLFQVKNVGGGKNFVDLINSAQGKYIAYLEGDDYWTDPNKLQKQFDFMETHLDYSLSYHKIKKIHTYAIDFEPEPISNIGNLKTITIDYILKRGWFIHSCSMFFVNFRLPEGFEGLFVGDYPLHVLLADKGKVGFLDECMGVYRISKEGYSEKNIHGNNYKKRKKNFISTIFLQNYLDKNTSYKYHNHFMQNNFGSIYSHLHYIFLNHKKLFLKELFEIIKSFNLFFLIYQMLLKTVRFCRSKKYLRSFNK